MSIDQQTTDPVDLATRNADTIVKRGLKRLGLLSPHGYQLSELLKTGFEGLNNYQVLDQILTQKIDLPDLADPSKIAPNTESVLSSFWDRMGEATNDPINH